MENEGLASSDIYLSADFSSSSLSMQSDTDAMFYFNAYINNLFIVYNLFIICLWVIKTLPHLFSGSTRYIALDPCVPPSAYGLGGHCRGLGQYIWYHPRRSVVTYNLTQSVSDCKGSILPLE